MRFSQFAVSAILFCAPTFVHAQKDFLLPPPNFDLTDGNRAVYTNFQWARTNIVVDVSKKRIEAVTQFEFQTWEDGMPLFDLVEDPISATLDGEPVAVKTTKTPDGETKMRIFFTPVTKGTHVAVVRNLIKINTKFSRDTASMGFWTSDLDDREYLEQYLPTNLEYDTYSIGIHLKVEGTDANHAIFTNGTIKPGEQNEWALSYPAHFNASSILLHLGPNSSFELQKTEFNSVDGRKLPVIVYTKDSLADGLENYTSVVHRTLRELELDYGPFPQDQMVVYANESFNGGMEFAGATITNLWALPHEITHSFFGRGVMPNNGNSGWMDEAIASWRDARYPRNDDPGYMNGNLAGFSPYRRWTTMDAYSKGRNFVGYLDSLLAQKGSSMKIFLKNLVTNHKHQPISTNMFKKWLEESYGESMNDIFSQYVYNGALGFIGDEDKAPRFNHFHPRLTKAQLEKLL